VEIAVQRGADARHFEGIRCRPGERELNLLLAHWITGRTGTTCGSTSRDPVSRPTMPSSKALIPALRECLSQHYLSR
jgi:hypothetical protein